ncbi:MAG: hypothetical protein JWN61_3385 [Pseudonocardiales bacterium]|nr:hypothetical protein [Jatrophihabitantaceae bacterium]MCW2605250.1 hypothetical protein [Pseudonocardiales bacterium]
MTPARATPGGEPDPPDFGGDDILSSSGEILPRAADASGSASGPGASGAPEGVSVGRFRQGSLSTQLALGRYLVGRVIIARISAGLMVTALVILAIAVLVWFVGPHWLAVLIGLLALPVLFVRSLVRWFIGKITEARIFGPAEDQVRKMIGDTGGDFRRELRRIGVPSGMFSFPLLLIRLMRRSSRRTLLDRMRGFDLTNVVPASRVDELHMLIRSVRRE